MSKEPSNKYHSPTLGRKLKNLREKRHESLAEASGAVEIETESLLNIEQDNEIPSEDILALLISHFNLKKEEARDLWDLAGYDRPSQDFIEQAEATNISPIVIMPFDNRVIYTDLVNISINNYGVVMNFLQTGSNRHNPPTTVAR